MNKQPVYAWKFRSDSSAKIYETLQYTDNSLSCDCPGWTRRCVNGQRTCKHVRMVQLGGEASYNAESHGPVGGLAAIVQSVKPPAKQVKPQPQPAVTHQSLKRKLNV